MIIICAVGMEWEMKVQNVLIAIIAIAMLNFLIGCVIGPNDNEAIAHGFVGFSGKKHTHLSQHFGKFYLYFHYFCSQLKRCLRTGQTIIEGVKERNKTFSVSLPSSSQVVGLN